MSDIKIYTLEDVMDILKVTKRTLYNYIKNGDLKAVKIGKYWKVSEEALRDFTEKGTTATKTDDEKLNELLGKYIEEYGFEEIMARLQEYKAEAAKK